MNDRIKELAEKSDIKFDANLSHLGIDTAVITTADLEKFTKLIVAKCVNQCEFVAGQAEITNTGEMARKTKATADNCAFWIKEYFGVEE